MKKLSLMLIGLLMFYSNPAFALVPIDIEYTGAAIELANDFPYTVAKRNNLEPIGNLGGPIENSFYLKRGFQFTVDEFVNVQYLSVDARLTPNSFDYPKANDPLGPAQSIDVSFSLYGASIFSPQQPQYEIPDPNELLLTKSLAFTTDDSVNIKFSDVKFPFEAQLTPGASYWIVAEDPKFSGVSFNYTTKFEGEVITPEPASLLLLGGGLAGALWRRRKVSKI